MNPVYEVLSTKNKGTNVDEGEIEYKINDDDEKGMKLKISKWINESEKDKATFKLKLILSL